MKDFLERIFAEKAELFNIKLADNGNGGYYEIFSSDGKINIYADTKTHAAAGVYRYLKDCLHVNYSWCGNRELNITEVVFPKEHIKQQIKQKYISMFNYCTYGYSMAYWKWERWEKELDFMALNGVNMPLFVVGLEAVWYHTLLKNGFEKDEALAFISSPSHFPWQLMTNIEGVMPCMSEELINQRLELGQKIMKRMLELGMTPIQMGFSGFVPRLFKEKYFKDSDIKKKNNWCGIDGTWELNPKDPLFKKIGTDFLETQNELFGSYHYYACDPFHESTPPVKGKKYLNDVSFAIQKMYADFDADYHWVMQSWSIRKDIAVCVPKDRLLILDLAGQKHTVTNNFWGYEYVTGNLHNFGGRINLHGDIRLLTKNKFLKLSRRSNAVGTGLFMEGIDQNPLYYDLAMGMMSSDKKIDLKNYLDDYCLRRYGVKNNKLLHGLNVLSKTVYKKGTNGVEKSSMICAHPALNVKKSGPNDGFMIPYSNRKLKNVLKEYIDAYTPNLKDGYFFDLYDIARQAASNELQAISKKIKKAYLKKNRKDFDEQTKRFLDIVMSVDKLLLTIQEFNFYNHINLADEYTNMPEINEKLTKAHKTLLTIWADIETPDIFDYAWREWGGLIGEFYAVRWKMFFDFLSKEFDSKDRYDLNKEKKLDRCYGREAFYANDFYKELGAFELSWIKGKYECREAVQSNDATLSAAKGIYEKIK